MYVNEIKQTKLAKIDMIFVFSFRPQGLIVTVITKRTEETMPFRTQQIHVFHSSVIIRSSPAAFKTNSWERSNVYPSGTDRICTV